MAGISECLTAGYLSRVSIIKPDTLVWKQHFIVFEPPLFCKQFWDIKYNTMIRYKDIIAQMITSTVNTVVRNFSVTQIYELTLLRNNAPVATCLWGQEQLKYDTGFSRIQLYKGSEAMCYFYDFRNEAIPTEVHLSGLDQDGTAFHLESQLNSIIASAAA